LSTISKMIKSKFSAYAIPSDFGHKSFNKKS
jgi:hypothetical protein